MQQRVLMILQGFNILVIRQSPGHLSTAQHTKALSDRQMICIVHYAWSEAMPKMDCSYWMMPDKVHGL